MNRILLESTELEGNRAVLRDQRAAHVREVLRANPGDTIRIGLLDGPCGSARLEAVTTDSVALTCKFEAVPPSRSRLNLLLALPRPKVLKRLWAPLASLGLDRIVLLNAARVERNYFDTHWIEPAHYRPLLVEGLQQCGDTRLPRVQITRRFRPFVEDELPALSRDAARLVADPYAAARLRDQHPPPDAPLWLAVGPEGGWIPFELDLLQRAGFQPVRAGSRILRSDIACIALLAVTAELSLAPTNDQ